MREFQVDVIKDWTRKNAERAYVNKNFTDIEQTLTSLTHLMMTICEEITKNWNRV